MTRILVVDDSEVDRRLAAGLLQHGGQAYEVDFAKNGREALARVRDHVPDLVLTDMQMPEQDGLELVKAVRVHYPQLPVILMTAYGSDDLAISALKAGAASYVPKTHLADRLSETVTEVLVIARSGGAYERLIGCLAHTELDFTLGNDAALIDPLVELLQQIVTGVRLCDANDRFRIGMALQSALLNALYRGNLEISSDQMRSVSEELLEGRGATLVEQRRTQAPYCNRRIHVEVAVSAAQARFTVRDEGPGFDVAAVQAATEPAALTSGTGRGLVLMRAFMDEVRFNQRGNEVTLIKHRAAGAAG